MLGLGRFLGSGSLPWFCLTSLAGFKLHGHFQRSVDPVLSGFLVFGGEQVILSAPMNGSNSSCSPQGNIDRRRLEIRREVRVVSGEKSRAECSFGFKAEFFVVGGAFAIASSWVGFRMAEAFFCCLHG